MQAGQINVLFTVAPPAELQAHLRSGLANINGLNLVFPETTGEETLLNLAPQADVMVGWRVSLEVLQAAERLQQYIFAGVGAQSILSSIKQVNEVRPVTLLKCIANTYATAQHAVALLLALTNQVIPHHNWMVEGHWRRGDDYASSTTLRDRHIGLLGYGAVNQNIHKFLAPYDVKFSILRRQGTALRSWLPQLAQQYQTDQLSSFLKAVDVLFVGVPLTDQTTGLIGAEELSLLGPAGLLVNVARGPVIDEGALFQALQARSLAGAALDVWYQYQPEPDHQGAKHPSAYPFHELANVVLSPHRAASPVFDLRRWNEVIDHLHRFASGAEPVNVVDLERGY